MSGAGKKCCILLQFLVCCVPHPRMWCCHAQGAVSIQGCICTHNVHECAQKRARNPVWAHHFTMTAGCMAHLVDSNINASCNKTCNTGILAVTPVEPSPSTELRRTIVMPHTPPRPISAPISLHFACLM